MPQEDRRLLVRYHREGDPAAREQLVARFLPLARQLARRYQRGGEQLDDLVQVASLGLLKAIDRFDPARETAFSSFAVPTILGELKRHFRDKGWSVRVPRDLQELAVKVDRVADEMSRELGRAPTPAEIAERTGTSLEQVLEAREASGRLPRGVARPPAHGRGGGRRLLRRRRRRRRPRLPASPRRRRRCERLMRVLSEREREVLRLRFEEDLTQSEIGARVGVSQMHVSRLIRQSIARLRDEAEPAPDWRYGSVHGPLGPRARSTCSRTIRRSCTRRAASRARSRSASRRARSSRTTRSTSARTWSWSTARSRSTRAAARSAAARASWRSSTRASATRCARRPTRGCCSCSRPGPATATPGARD